MELKKKLTPMLPINTGSGSSIDDSIQELLVQSGSIKTTELFFEMAKNLICVIGPDGHVKKMSRSFIDVSGYAEIDLISAPFLDFVVKHDVLKENGSTGYYFSTHFCCRNNRIAKITWRVIPDICGGNTFLLGWEIPE